ncbi:MAG: hypothetical protein ABIZ04_26345 [Opitutus sp.]
MQLSAPSLPLDPTSTLSESSGKTARRPSTAGESKRADDFGEILSSKSAQNTGRASGTPNRSNNKGLNTKNAEHKIDSDEREDEKDLRDLNLDRPISVSDNQVTSTNADPANTSLSILSPADAELALSLLNGAAAPESTSEAGESVAIPSSGGEAAEVTPGTPPSATPQGRPFLGDVTPGKAQAAYRAFGFNAQRVLANKAEGRAANAPLAVAAPALPSVPATSEPPPSVADGNSVPSDSAPSEVAVTGAPLFSNAGSAAPEFGDVPDLPTDVPAEPSDAIAASEGSPQPSSSILDQNSIDGASDPVLPVPVGDESLAVFDDVAPTVAFPETADTAAEVDADFGATVTVESPRLVSTTREPNTDTEAATPPDEHPVPEKFAEAVFRQPERAPSIQKTGVKSTVSVDPKQLMEGYGRIGINVAKPESSMSATSFTSNPAPALTVNPSAGVLPVSFDARVADSGSQSPAPTEQAARRAVESALAVAEQFAPGEQRSVRLQFNVGGEDLAVRVELRGDQVHTTFRTDSPELRTALAREWQAVSTSQSSERGQRLADPVFASSSSGQSLSGDSGAAHRRDPETRQAQFAAHEANQMRRILRSPSTIGASPVSSPAASAQPSTSLRLHTFA